MLLLVQIIKEIQAAKFFIMLAIEVTDSSNMEQVSVVIRYVDGKNIKKDFNSRTYHRRVSCNCATFLA